jgi:glycosyltransferase involved in cell wall biosynthesis
LELELYRQGYQLVLLGHESIPAREFDEILNGLPPGIRNFVFITNDIDDEDLLAIYQATTLFVYPSKAEGFGIPPLEAAALKIPVLCSNTSAMKDFAFFGDNHFDPYDYGQFKQKLKNILEHPPSTAFLRRVAEIIRQEYSWQQSAEKLFGLLAKNKSS